MTTDFRVDTAGLLAAAGALSRAISRIDGFPRLGAPGLDVFGTAAVDRAANKLEDRWRAGADAVEDRVKVAMQGLRDAAQTYSETESHLDNQFRQ